MERLCSLILTAGVAIELWAQPPVGPRVPRTWDEAKLAEWATPLAGINVRPAHMSAKEYYSLPVDNLKTYPVYLPSREPAGYWEMLQRIGPKPLIEPVKLKTEADWIEAGRRVFQDADHIQLRTFDPQFIALARDEKALRERAPDGTEHGVALTFPNCSSCHTAFLDDGRTVPGAPLMGVRRWRTTGLVGRVHAANRVVHHSPFIMAAGVFGARLYQAWGVPWRKNDIHQRLRTLNEAEYEPMRVGFTQSGGFPRWNGSIFFPAKMPDLIGIKDRKYIDHTATHLHRDIGDLMRYAALVTIAETVDFGDHRILTAGCGPQKLRQQPESRS
jgi:hypothetical protein